MNIDDLGSSAHVKLAKILNALVEHHNVYLDFTKANFDQLMEVHDQCIALAAISLNHPLITLTTQIRVIWKLGLFLKPFRSS